MLLHISSKQIIAQLYLTKYIWNITPFWYVSKIQIDVIEYEIRENYDHKTKQEKMLFEEQFAWRNGACSLQQYTKHIKLFFFHQLDKCMNIGLDL